MSQEIEKTWAEEEFGAAELGDERRVRRLVELAYRLAQAPTASLPNASQDPAMLKAAYRFFDNDEIEAQAILASHIQATQERLRTVPVVLAVQDTTLLDWGHHPATTGLGPLGSERQQGLVMHSTLAITPERLPLGMLSQQVWARDPETYGALPDRRSRSIEEKESHKWLVGLEATNEAAAACPNTHFVAVGDREADIYDLLIAERAANVDLLVRAAHDRRVDDPEYRRLRQAAAAAPVLATIIVDVPRQHNRPARRATLEVRACQVTLLPPRHRSAEHLPPVTVGVVWASEINPPADAEPLDWLLVTTLPVLTIEHVTTCLEWYTCRFGIEVWHRVLKTGCRIESRHLQTADRLIRCLAVFGVIAWRILYTTMLARAAPTLPCTVALEDAEWQALYCTIHHVPTPPSEPPSLYTAVRWIAQLGGFLGRKGDGEPGPTVLWRGFQHLVDLTTMYRILSPPVSGLYTQRSG